MAEARLLNPLENLSRDHVNISLALDAIDAAIVTAGEGDFETGKFELIVEFIEVWADGAHYEKEEQLFVELEGIGIPRAAGPTAFLELEHQATRDHAARMRQALIGLGGGQVLERTALLDALARYTSILRVHMPKEDLGYFRMAAAMLGQSALERLGQKFEAIDARLPVTFAEAAGALVRAEPVRARQPEADVLVSWHDRHDRQVREIVRTLNLGGEGVGSPLRITRRRRPA